jgi:hypothetical protein
MIKRLKLALDLVDRQAYFNIGMSFLALSFASQVYQAKVVSCNLEPQL